MKGKIRVYCRARPLSRSELERVIFISYPLTTKDCFKEILKNFVELDLPIGRLNEIQLICLFLYLVHAPNKTF